jgi:PKD repeat protein
MSVNATAALPGDSITLSVAPIGPTCVDAADRSCIVGVEWEFASNDYRLVTESGTWFASFGLAECGFQDFCDWRQGFALFPSSRYYTPFGLRRTETCGLGSTTCTFALFKDERNTLPLFPSWVVVFKHIVVRDADGVQRYEPVEVVFRLGSAAANLPPTADFTFSQLTPGVVSFDGTTSTDPENDGLVHTWDFGDGTSDIGAAVPHTYDTPGTYPVTLTVTDIAGNRDSVTKEVVVEAPSFTLDLSFIGANGERTNSASPAIGEELRVEVALRAGAGVGDLTDLAVDLPSLTPPSSSPLELLTDPLPALPTDALAPGEDTAVELRYRVTGPGRAALSSSAQAKDAAGRVVSDEDEIVASASPFEIEITQEPTEPSILDGGDPLDLTVTVAVTNTTDAPVDGVHLPDELLLGWAKEPHPAVLPVMQTTAPDPLLLGTIGPGATKSGSYTVEATDDGLFSVEALVTYAGSTGATAIALGTGQLRVGTPYLLAFEATVTSPASGLLPAGDSIVVTGKVTNLSNTHTLALGPVLPEVVGNGGIPVISEDGAPPDWRTMPEPPLWTLGPREWKTFTVWVATGWSDPFVHDGPPGGTRTDLRFTPWARATDVDGVESIVTTGEVRTDREQLLHRVAIDDSIFIPEQPATDVFAGTTLGALEGGWHAIAALPGMVVDLLTAPVTMLYGLSAYQAQVWRGLTEEERDEASRDIGYLAALMLMRNAEAGQQGLEALWDQANASALDVLTKNEQAWYTGDRGAVARTYASFMSNQVTSIVAPIAAGKMLANSTRAQAAVQRVQAEIAAASAPILDQLAATGLVDEAARLVRTLRNGTIASARHLAAGWGITEAEAQVWAAIAKSRGILITLRARSLESVRLIARFGAVLKPESIKIKAVNHLDRLLGYKVPGDVGKVVFKKPIALIRSEKSGRPIRVEMEEMLRAQSVGPGDKAWYEAQHRLATRLEEWFKYEQRYKDWDKRQLIDVGTDWRSQGIIEPGTRQTDWRGFRMTRQGADDAEEYLLEIWDNGSYRMVTGDTDMVALSELDSTGLSVDRHRQILDELYANPATRARHGDSASFEKPPDGDGIGFLERNLKGEKAIQVGPDGRWRVVELDAADSQWFGSHKYRLRWLGGYVHAGGHPAGSGSATTDLAAATRVLPEPGAGAVMLLGAGQASTNLGRCRVEQTTSADGTAVVEDDRVVEVAPVTTKPLDVKRCFEGSGGPVTLETGGGAVLTADAPAGATRLEIGDGTLAARGDDLGFDVGDAAVIGAGGPGAEVVTVDGFGSLLLAAPTRQGHQQGDLVIVAPAPTAAGAVTGPLPRTGGTGIGLWRLGAVLLLVGGATAAAACAAHRRRRPC